MLSYVFSFYVDGAERQKLTEAQRKDIEISKPARDIRAAGLESSLRVAGGLARDDQGDVFNAAILVSGRRAEEKIRPPEKDIKNVDERIKIIKKDHPAEVEALLKAKKARDEAKSIVEAVGAIMEMDAAKEKMTGVLAEKYPGYKELPKALRKYLIDRIIDPKAKPATPGPGWPGEYGHATPESPMERALTAFHAGSGTVSTVPLKPRDNLDSEKGLAV